jgi:diguanylate cyclase (GGDEF)-like protein
MLGLRGTLLWLVQGILALSLAAAVIAWLEIDRREELTDFKDRSEKVIQAVGVTSAVYVAQNDLGGLDTLVSHLTTSLRTKGLVELAVVNDEGRVLAHSETDRFNTVLEGPHVQEAIGSDGVVWVRSESELFIAVPARSGIRWATVVARFSLAQVYDNIERMRRKVGLVALVFLVLLGAVVSFGLERLVVRPVRQLQQAVRRIAEGHLSTRVPPLKGLELAELSETVNRMAAALQSERQNLESAVAERTRELQEANVRLERLAVTDGLTNVFNHRRLQEVLHDEVLRSQRHQRPVGVLMIDVDFFKRVNDSFGHPVGDQLLRRLAEVLRGELRQTDTLARYGGEEFAVVLPETSKQEALQVAERMRLAVEHHVNQGRDWGQRVTISIGVASLPDDGVTEAGLLISADEALYLAKRQGRNRVVGVKAIG